MPTAATRGRCLADEGGLDNQRRCFLLQLNVDFCDQHGDNLTTRSLSSFTSFLWVLLGVTSFRVDVAVGALYCRYYIDVKTKII